MSVRLTRPQEEMKRRRGKPVLVMAHRGMPVRFPENTMRSFREVLSLDIDIIEFDVHKSLDGGLLVIHDPSLERTSNGTGAVREKTTAELRALDMGAWKDPAYAGERMPTLEETYELFVPHGHILLNVEVKDADKATAAAAVSLADRYGILDRCVFTSFDALLMAYMKSLDRRVRTQGFPRHCMSNFTDDSFAAMDYVGVPAGAATYELFSWYADRGIEHGVWCIDDAKSAVSMAERGACIITSNDPGIVIDALRGGGYR